MKQIKDIKLKYYLRGLGTGIVITTLVLAISFNVRSCTSQDNKEENTKIEDTTTEDTTTEDITTEDTTTEDITTEDTTTEDTTKEKTTKEKVTKETTTEKITKEDKPTEEETTEVDTTKEVTTKGIVTLTVTNGMASDTVAALLENAGAIDSAIEFNKYLYQMGYERIIRVGTYEIEVGASYEEIARLITNQN